MLFSVIIREESPTLFVRVYIISHFLIIVTFFDGIFSANLNESMKVLSSDRKRQKKTVWHTAKYAIPDAHFYEKQQR